mgnify:CR=1 FL=1
MGAQSLCDLLRGFEGLAGAEAGFGGGNVFGAALLVRGGNVSLSVLLQVRQLPPL